MSEINIQKYAECNFRRKRTENEYNKNNIIKKEMKNLNLNSDIDFINNENINSFIIQNDNNNTYKYPEYKSFLQLYPKENAEIPSIKYYNYIFSIGSPFN